MASGSQRIVFEIDANASELEAAVKSASAALKNLGDIVKRQSAAAVAAGDETVKANQRVAASFQEALTAARNGARGAVTAAEEQAKAQTDLAAKATASADKQVASSARASQAMTDQARAAQVSADRQLAAAEKTGAAFGASESRITKSGKTILVGMAAVGVGAIDMAAKYQTATLRLQTQAGATSSQLDKLRKGMLAMAAQVGYTPNQLAAGMFHVVSSLNAVLPPAQRVSGELHVLKVAAQLAQIGGSNLEETTYALASAMNALHAPVRDAAKIAGELNAIVGSGDMTMTDLVDALKSGVIPSARVAGLSLQSLGAAMAVMGDLGVRGAMAGTRLRMSIALLASPSAASAKVLEALGMSAKEATSRSQAMADALQKAGLRTTSMTADMKQPNGILVALQDLESHLRSAGLTSTGVAAVMNKVFGGGRMGSTIITLSQNLDRLDAKYKQIGQTTNQFGSDWTKTSHTFRLEVDQAVAGVEALGIKLGTDLMPYATKALHEVESLATSLGHNKTVLDALGVSVIAFSTVAIGSFFYSKVKGASLLIKELGSDAQSAVRWLLQLGRTNVAAGIAGGGRPGAPGALGAAGGMGIGGARSGFGLPGSPMNPLVVAIEASEYTGLGSQGAIIGQKGALAATASQSGGSVLAAEEAAVGAAGATEGRSLLSVLKTGLGGLMRGGIIAGGGLLAGQAADQIIGGATGHKVSVVIDSASIGAGLGSILGPEGTLAGGVLGALTGAVAQFLSTDAVAEGRKFADAFTKDLPGKVKDSVKQGVVDSTTKVANTPKPGNFAGSPGIDPALIRNHPGEILNPTLFNKAFDKQFNQLYTAVYAAGKHAGDAFVNGWQNVKFPTTLTLVRDAQQKLNEVPASVRKQGPEWVRLWQDEAAKQMIAYATTLEENGKLPKGAVDNMIASLEQSFPGLTAYLDRVGQQTENVIAKAMTLTQAQGNWKRALETFRSDWGDTAISQKLTTDNIVANTHQAMSDLETIIHTSTGKQKADAIAEYKSLQQTVSGTFQSMADDVDAKQQAMTKSIATGSAQAAQQAATNLYGYEQSVYQAMSQGLLSSNQGAQLITKALDATLKAFGAKQIPMPTAVSGMSAPGKGLHAGLNAATGGFIGSPGEKGRDTVHTVLGRGEAVLNAPQQEIVNQYVPGGLPAVFQQTAGKLHYMAGGGYAGYSLPLPRGEMMPGAWSIDQGVDIPAPAGTPEYAIGPGVIVGEGISGFGPNAPILRITAGPLAGRSVYYGHAGPDLVRVGQSVRAGQQISEVGAGIVGMSTGPHIEFGYYPPGGNGAGAVMATTLQQLMGGAGVTGSGMGLPMISAPGVSGTGTITDLVRHGLAMSASAANAYLARVFPSVGAAGVSGTAAAQGAQYNLQSLEQLWVQAGGSPAAAHVMGAIALAESGGNPRAHNASGASGLWQILGVPFPGNVWDPLTNARMAVAKYNTQGLGAWQTYDTGAYQQFMAAGGIAGDVGYLPGHGHSKVLKAPKGHKPKVPKSPHSKGTGLTDKDLKELAALGGKLAGYETDLATILGGGGSQGEYASLQSRFSVEEGESQYLNPDGSLNAAGYAKKIADDRILLGLQEKVLGDYRAELPVVGGALRKWLGKGNRTQHKINVDTNKISANKRQLANDKVRAAAIRQAILDVQKPEPNAVAALQSQISKARLSHQPAIDSALRAQHAYRGKDKATKAALSQAVFNARQAEQAAVSPLQNALVDAQTAQRQRKFNTSTETWKLRKELADLAKRDAQLTKGDTLLGQDVTSLRGILTGAGGQQSTDQTITLLETIASKLGQVKWGGDGAFLGINTSDQGAAFDTQTTIMSLQNDLSTLGSQAGQAGTGQTNTQLVSLLQQENLQLSQALSLSQSQFGVLQGFAPMLASAGQGLPAFAHGGPIMNTGLAMVHRGEYISTDPQGPYGSQLAGQPAAAPNVTVHVHGDLAPLVSMVRHEIDGRAPAAVSAQQGRRGRAIFNAPGRPSSFVTGGHRF